MHNGSNNEQITRLTVSCYHKTFCGRSMTVPSTEPDWCMVFVILSPGAPEGSTSSDSALNLARRRGHSLSLIRQTVTAANRTRDPCVQGE